MEQTKECAKDYSLLRPFDLEAAKRGDSVMEITDDEKSNIIWTNKHGEVLIDWNSVGFCIYDKNKTIELLRMAPICWVEGKPVYKGDVLYRKDLEMKQVTAASIFNNGSDYLQFEEGGNARLSDGGASLTWAPPKVKREGWVNVYSAQESVACLSDAWPTKEKCDALQRPGRIACVRIEWEE